jgi:UTP--glucose-1-phosphate uridylyltransferase
LLKFPLKAVIPAAGTGTRLLPTTKEQPKELLPVFSRSVSGNRLVKPILQLIFEQLFDCGIREFYFIGGRNKRMIEDHFSVDFNFIDKLNREDKSFYAEELSIFYNKVSSSNISWINQPIPKGFGHAVSLAKSLVGNEPFLVHAGDTLILSKTRRYIHDLIKTHDYLHSLSTFLVCSVEDPRRYGVITGRDNHNGVIFVESIIEKPSQPESNLAIMPIYVFDQSIFSVLEKTAPGINNEIQLTDGIGALLASNKNKVIAVRMNNTDLFVDVGNPETYWHALKVTYNETYSYQEPRNQSYSFF